jgi:hypothetical protein
MSNRSARPAPPAQEPDAFPVAMARFAIAYAGQNGRVEAQFS